MIEQKHFLLKVEMIENRWELELKFSACFIYSLKVSQMRSLESIELTEQSLSLSHSLSLI